MDIDITRLTTDDVTKLVVFAKNSLVEFEKVHKRRPYNMRNWERYLYDFAKEVLKQCQKPSPQENTSQQ